MISGYWYASHRQGCIPAIFLFIENNRQPDQQQLKNKVKVGYLLNPETRGEN
jgi:hypothetical protein